MEVAVMLVQVSLLLMVVVMVVFVVARVNQVLLGVMVTAAIPLLLAMALPLLRVQEPLIVVITTIGKQQCKTQVLIIM
jgi:hypothetical protein